VHAHSRAASKALLAALDRATLAEVLEGEGMPAFTSHTITNARRLVDQLDCALAHSYAVDRDEKRLGVSCIDMAIRTPAAAAVAAINVSLLETRTFPDGVLLTRYQTRR
jgi:IclR family transcriptional regulator, acetate operon repressor